MEVLATDKAVRRQRRHPLLWHYLEMVLAMIVGMAVFGGLISLGLAVAGHPNLLEHVSIRAPIMATNMCLGMALWMRHRGHAWRDVGEMSLAMYVPLLVVYIPFLVGALPQGAVLGPMHLLMFPAMAIVMLRRREVYAQ